MLKLYAYAITAKKQLSGAILMSTKPGALKADSENEALGAATKIAREVFPGPEFFEHQASVAHIPKSALEDLED